MIPVNRVRIVVGYPSDAREGRIALERCVAQQFFKDYCSEHKLDVEVIAWDTHAGPGLHQGGPQEWIDLALNIQESDLFVAIFEGKLGTPYKQYASGTVYEIDSAISSFKERQSPQVWVCVPSSNESTESRYKLSSELGDFIAKLSSGTDADYGPLYLDYDSSDDLFQKLSSWLFKFLIKQGRRESSADTAHKSTVRYDIHADPIDMPTECLTAPAGPLIITFQGDKSCDVGSWRSGRVEVYINTILTSPLLGALSLTTLQVQQPDGSFGSWKNVGSVLGYQFAPNAIRFDVSFQFTSIHRLVRMSIDNLFVNAGLLGISDTAEKFVVAHVGFSSHNEGELLPIPGIIQGKIGRVVPAGFVFHLDSPAEQTISDINILTVKAKDWAVLRFTGTLNSRLPAKFVESLYNNTLPRSSSYCGLRLLLRVHSTYSKYVCVPTRLASTSRSSGWPFVRADVNGAGRYPLDEIEQIAVDGKLYYVIAGGTGSVTAAYEPESMADAFAGFSELKIQLLSLLDLFPFIPFTSFFVAFCLAPLSTVSTSSQNAPLPRFFDFSHSIGTSFRPLPTRTV